MTLMTAGSEGRDDLALELNRLHPRPSRPRMSWLKKLKKSRRPFKQLGPSGVLTNIAVGPLGLNEGVSRLVWRNLSTYVVDLTTAADISNGSRRSMGGCQHPGGISVCIDLYQLRKESWGTG